MDTQVDIAKIKELLDKSNEVLIVTHERPTFDSIGSSLALSLGLAGLGKRVTVACPDPMTVELSSFVGVNKVVADVSKKNFIISLDYVDGSIEKVSYNIEGDKFNLVIEPRPGFESFSADKVHYSHAGGNADLIIAIDTIHLGGLKQLYEANKEMFSGKAVVNIDRHPNNTHFGVCNLVDPSASSTAELVAQILTALGAPLTIDLATNFLNALYGATNYFSSTRVSAGAFELAAACVKAGGKRFQRDLPSEEIPGSGELATESVAPAFPPHRARPQTTQIVDDHAGHTHPHPQANASGQVSQLVTGQAPSPGMTSGSGQSSQSAPADWLKPKIFKSSSLV